MQKPIKNKKSEREIIDLATAIKEYWDSYQGLLRSGDIEGRYQPDWWLNKQDDPMNVFLKWMLATQIIEEDETN